jgi:Skp family chaperone for outer membrane proteins
MMIRFFLCTAVAGMALAAQAQQAPPANPPQQSAPTPKPQAPATTASAANTASTILPVRIGLISLRDALTGTAEGKKALLDLEEKFGSRRTALQKRQIDLQTKQDQLNRAGSTMSDQAKAAMARELETGGKTLQRDGEDLKTDMEDAQNKVFGEIYGKMQPLISQYATKNGYATLIDVSSEQASSFVVWASNSTNVTEEIVNLYNQAHPSTGVVAPPAAKPPVVPPATKKQ